MTEKVWDSLIKPKKLEIEEETYNSFYGKFLCEPLEKGFGTTIGNSLRRILLSSIQGAAIVAVKIDNVLHEFCSIPGVVEDVPNIILNVKEIRLKLHTPGPHTLRLHAKGEGVVRAKDIATDSNVEILNPGVPIATLNKDGELSMEMVAKTGKGYVPAERNKDENAPLSTIAIDAIFSPIRKVQYAVTKTRVGHITDYDRLTLEIHTDGSINPEESLSQAARILRSQMNIFISSKERETHEEFDERKEKEEIDENLYRSINELELSVRSANCLKNANIRLIGELVQKTEVEMLKTKNFGRKSLNEIKELLSEMSLSLGMKIDYFDPDKHRKDNEAKAI